MWILKKSSLFYLSVVVYIYYEKWVQLISNSQKISVYVYNINISTFGLWWILESIYSLIITLKILALVYMNFERYLEFSKSSRKSVIFCKYLLLLDIKTFQRKKLEMLNNSGKWVGGSNPFSYLDNTIAYNQHMVFYC